jgi:hypothetical protein
MHRHPPSQTPNRAARREPTASVTARMSPTRSTGPYGRETGFGQPRPPLIEEDHPGESRKPPQKTGQARLFPAELKMRDDAGHEHQNNRATSESLIDDVHLPAPGIARDRHHISLQRPHPAVHPTPLDGLSGQRPYEGRFVQLIKFRNAGGTTADSQNARSGRHRQPGAEPGVDGRPGRRRLVQSGLRATSRRCQASSVAGSP